MRQFGMITIAVALGAVGLSGAASADGREGHGRGQAHGAPGRAGALASVGANSTVQADRAALQASLAHLNADRFTRNTAAIPSDLASVEAARQKLATDQRSVYSAIVNDPTVKSDQNLVTTALTTLSQAISKLWSDQYTRNTGALAGDVAAVQTARAQVQADRSTLGKDEVAAAQAAKP